ncbi:hypothetical protein FOFC_02702 [Fusarium oxysporum]|nr:hypothetical protein FOFC_02702 [Fusarium oxysporum]
MTAPSKRHNRHARACDTCRKQKKRCEGEAPKCKTCKRTNKKCTWTPSPIMISQYRGGHKYRKKTKRYEEVNARGPEPEVSSTAEIDRAAQTLSLYASTGDSLNDKSTAASRTSLEHLNYDKIRRCGEIYFQEWAPLFPALTETEFDKALDGFFDNTDPSSRNLHVTQIYLVVDIVGISSKGHGLEQLPTCTPRWQAILDAAELEPSIQTLQCFTLSLLCCIKHRDYKRLCLYMERAIGLYKNLFLHEDDKDEKHPGVAVENHKGIVWTLFILDCFSAAANDRRMELKYQDIEPTNPHKVDYPDDEASTALYLLRAAQILAQVLAEYPVSPDDRHSFSQRMKDLNSKLRKLHGKLPDRHSFSQRMEDLNSQDMKSSHPALMTITYHYILAHIHKLAFHFGKKDEHVQNFSLFQTSCKTILDLVGRLEEKDLNLPLCLNRNDLVSFQRVYECLALAILACIKIAIHLEDCQALVNGTTIRRLFWRASIFIILIMSISTLVTIVLVNRRPYDHSNIGEFWKRKPRRDLFTSMIISGAIQLPTDLLMIALPQFVLWRLRSGWRKKLKAVLVLGSGVIPCTVGFVSLILTVIYSGRADSVWYIRRLELLKNAEMACWLVIRAAKCIPQIIWAHESVEGQESATDIPRQPSSKEFGLEGGLAGAGSKEVLWDPTLSKG